MDPKEDKCWSGYERVPGKRANTPGSCKKADMKGKEDMGMGGKKKDMSNKKDMSKKKDMGSKKKDMGGGYGKKK